MTLLVACMITGGAVDSQPVAVASGTEVDTSQPAQPAPLPVETEPAAEPQEVAEAEPGLATVARAFAEAKAAQDAVEQSTEVTP